MGYIILMESVRVKEGTFHPAACQVQVRSPFPFSASALPRTLFQFVPYILCYVFFFPVKYGSFRRILLTKLASIVKILELF